MLNFKHYGHGLERNTLLTTEPVTENDSNPGTQPPLHGSEFLLDPHPSYCTVAQPLPRLFPRHALTLELSETQLRISTTMMIGLSSPFQLHRLTVGFANARIHGRLFIRVDTVVAPAEPLAVAASLCPQDLWSSLRSSLSERWALLMGMDHCPSME